MGWDLVKLSDVCNIVIGRTPARKNPAYWGKGFPWVSISDMNTSKRISRTKEQITALALTETNIPVVPKDTVLYSFKLSIGKVCITACDIYTNEAIAALHVKNKEDLDFNYLSYVMSAIRVHNSDRAVMGQTLNKHKLKQIKIPLPPLPEQKRIASLLDAADKLRKQRKQNIAMLDKLLQATFLEMFGDPVVNPKGWNRKELGKIFKVKSGDGLTSKEMVTSGKYFVYGGNGINGFHDKYMFEDSKIILGRVGVYCGVVHLTKPRSWITDNALYVSELFVEINQTYLLTALEWANLNQYAGQAAQPLISGNRIYPVEINLPPLTLQSQFAKIVEKVEAQKAVQQAHLAELDILFACLQQRAFAGNL